MISKDEHYHFRHKSDKMIPVQRFLIGMTWYHLYRNRAYSWQAFVLEESWIDTFVLENVPAEEVFDFLAKEILKERESEGRRTAKFMGQMIEHHANQVLQGVKKR
jgi:quinol monooxygenase YgiN